MPCYMLYHSTYKDIIKNAQCNGPCSEIILKDDRE